MIFGRCFLNVFRYIVESAHIMFRVFVVLLYTYCTFARTRHEFSVCTVASICNRRPRYALDMTKSFPFPLPKFVYTNLFPFKAVRFLIMQPCAYAVRPLHKLSVDSWRPVAPVSLWTLWSALAPTPFKSRFFMSMPWNPPNLVEQRPSCTVVLVSVKRLDSERVGAHNTYGQVLSSRLATLWPSTSINTPCMFIWTVRRFSCSSGAKHNAHGEHGCQGCQGCVYLCMLSKQLHYFLQQKSPVCSAEPSHSMALYPDPSQTLLFCLLAFNSKEKISKILFREPRPDCKRYLQTCFF